MSLISQPAELSARVQRVWSSRAGADVRGPRGLFTTYVLSRLILILIPLGLFWYPGGTLLVTDIHLYWTWAEVILAGHYPVADPMWQYPPLAGFVFVLGTKVVTDPLLGFMALALIADASIFGALYRSSRGTGSLAGPWTYVIAGLAVGPVLLTRFDVFPTLFAVLALLCLARPVRGGIMLGVGALLKVWPAFLIVSFSRRQLPKALAALVAICAAGAAILVNWGPNAGSFLSEQGQRGLQIESVGAAPYVLANFFGYDMVTVFRYGSLEVDATGAGTIASLVALAGFVAMGVVGYARLRGRLENVAGADVALLMVLISIASSRVFSPQYMVWVAGIAGVCMLSKKTRMKPIIGILIAVSVLGQLVYPLNYGSMIDGGWAGVTFQLARIALLVVATVWAFIRVMRPAASPDPYLPTEQLDVQQYATTATDPKPSGVLLDPSAKLSSDPQGS